VARWLCCCFYIIPASRQASGTVLGYISAGESTLATSIQSCHGASRTRMLCMLTICPPCRNNPKHLLMHTSHLQVSGMRRTQAMERGILLRCVIDDCPNAVGSKQVDGWPQVLLLFAWQQQQRQRSSTAAYARFSGTGRLTAPDHSVHSSCT
jgi:hypothetical protein